MDNNNNNKINSGHTSINSTLSQRINLLESKNSCDLIINQNLLEIADDDSDWEFPRDKYVWNKFIKQFNYIVIINKNRLKLGKLIDEGAFGRVYQADAYGIIQGRYKSMVAVKTLKGTINRWN